MSVYVSNFQPGDGTWTVTHDDAPGGPHSGSIAPATVGFGTNTDGSPNHLFTQVVCPVCGSVSLHPIGGGAQPASVQRMFVWRLMNAFTVPAPMQAYLQSVGFPANFPWVPPRTWLQARALAKVYVILMDGAPRWMLETVNQGQ